MEPVLLSSRIRDVSVYRSGALIVRQVMFDGSDWPGRIAIADLPIGLQNGSVRARWERLDDRTDQPLPAIGDLRVELAVPPLGQPVEPPSGAELREASARVERLDSEIARLEEECSLFDRIEMRLPERIEQQPPRSVSAQVWAEVVAWIGRSRTSRLEQLRALQPKLIEAREQLQRLQRKQAEARAERGVSEDAITKRVIMNLEGPASGPAAALLLEYAVSGAAWRPTYALRMAADGQSAELNVRALVAQRTGEPWEGVRLSLSTADWARRTALPELKSLRIGRRQPEPLRPAFRAPPDDTDSLFDGLRRALADRPVEPVPAAMPLGTRTKPTVMDREEGARLPEMDRDEVDYASDLALQEDDELENLAMPMAKSNVLEYQPPEEVEVMASRASTEEFAKRRSRMAAQIMKKEALEEQQMAPPAPSMPQRQAEVRPPREQMGNVWELGDDWSDYGRLHLAGWQAESGLWGRLVPLSLADQLPGLSAAGLHRAQAHMERVWAEASDLEEFPIDTVDVEESSGRFDHTYRTTGLVDVPADGKLHALPVFSREAQVAVTLVVVPRESEHAIRVANFGNPLNVPLLAGPADIYLAGDFLVRSRIDSVPSGGQIQVGMGVEEALKVARHVSFEESTEGLLKGKTILRHRVTLELASRLSSQVQVEVRERIPIKEDTDKESLIEVERVQPDWQEFSQSETNPLRGGKCWRFQLPAGEERTLSYAYAIHIDARNELVGGNQRERGAS